MPQSVYIHIPFCKGKCKYCSFISFNKPELIKGYIFSLLKEITENYSGEKVKTLYFGGGTPSLIPADLLKKVICKFNLQNDCEITIELNPDDANEEYLRNLYDIGINRISIGSQTFDDSILSLIGRRHNSKQIEDAVKMSKKAGFENISLDLIYGLPNQTIEILKRDIDKILELDVQHISTYGLKIEENSYFYNHMPENIPDDDIQADMYLLINNILEKEGFKRYEVSNFAKIGYESNHNLNYWKNEEYYGFGISAHGYVNGVRYSNFNTIEKYMENPAEHEYGNFLTKQEKLEEEIFLGLRKTEGINISNINQKFCIDFEKKYSHILDKYNLYFNKKQNNYSLNIDGVLISNVILSEFIE